MFRTPSPTHRPNATHPRRTWTAVLAAAALAAALLLPAVPAAAEPAAPADGWAATLAAWLGAWFARPAADAAHPHYDPDGSTYTPPPDDGGEAHPHMDPNG